MRVSQKQSYKNTSYISEENNSNYLIMEKIREYLDVKTVTKINRTKEKYVELSYEVRTNKKTCFNKIFISLSFI